MLYNCMTRRRRFGITCVALAIACFCFFDRDMTLIVLAEPNAAKPSALTSVAAASIATNQNTIETTSRSTVEVDHEIVITTAAAAGKPAWNEIYKAAGTLGPDHEASSLQLSTSVNEAVQTCISSAVHPQVTITSSPRTFFRMSRSSEASILAWQELVRRGWVAVGLELTLNNATKEPVHWDQLFPYKPDFIYTTMQRIDHPGVNKKVEFLYAEREGSFYISRLIGVNNLVGPKSRQFVSKVNFMERRSFGCTFHDLRMMPLSYDLNEIQQCEAFFSTARSNPAKPWIAKVGKGSSQGGKGIQLVNSFSDIERVLHLDGCEKSNNSNWILQEYIADPLLIRGHKFDVREYFFVASTKPLMVFYHPGYIRRCVTAFSAELTEKSSHVTNTHIQRQLPNYNASEHILSTSELSNLISAHAFASVQHRIKTICRFLINTVRDKIVPHQGAHQIFGVDYLLDRHKNVFFLEANGQIGLDQETPWQAHFLRTFTRHAYDLLFDLQETVSADVQQLRLGQKYKDTEFELIIDDRESICEGSDTSLDYSPCREFGAAAEVEDV